MGSEGPRRAHRAPRHIDRAPNLTFLERTVNGQPGLVVQHDGAIVSVLAFHVARDRITTMWSVRNPDKLRLWTTG